MSQVDEALVRQMVEQVLAHVQTGWGSRVAPTAGQSAAPPVSLGPAGRAVPASRAVSASQAVPATRAVPASRAVSAPATGSSAISRLGQFADVAEAVEAAGAAQRALARRSLAQREQACELIRAICRDRADELGRMEYEETRIGHAAHKPQKLIVAAEMAVGVASLRTEAWSGDHGITLEEHAPWGVIGALTPVTHSLPTLMVNAVQMIAAGNAAVFNPHPGGKRIAAYGARLFNEAIYAKLGIDNLVCVIVEPTLESAGQIFRHPDVRLLCITGGPGAVAAAMNSGKRAICAGPGNPPVVVDSSADLDNAARCIVEGATFDNNLLCLSEKEVFVEAAVFEPLMAALGPAGGHRVGTPQMDRLASICIEQPKAGSEHYVAKRQFVGAEAAVIAREIDLNVPPTCRMLFGETGPDHPFVHCEQMMPVLPVVRCDSFEQAVERAKQAEHRFRHTSIIHSRLVDHMTHMGKELDTTLFIKNGPSLAGDAAGGEGYGSYSIACTTGEGVTTPLTFTRIRRCTMVDNLRII